MWKLDGDGAVIFTLQEQTVNSSCSTQRAWREPIFILLPSSALRGLGSPQEKKNTPHTLTLVSFPTKIHPTGTVDIRHCSEWNASAEMFSPVVGCVMNNVLERMTEMVWGTRRWRKGRRSLLLCYSAEVCIRLSMTDGTCNGVAALKYYWFCWGLWHYRILYNNIYITKL